MSGTLAIGHLGFAPFRCNLFCTFSAAAGGAREGSNQGRPPSPLGAAPEVPVPRTHCSKSLEGCRDRKRQFRRDGPQ
ncbi:hypothetical protein D9Q98_001280 [Chlorella vulgaris]|uniref:Uncharacterized protein n=1 Tax=Chlorella vulgaris TaxID=3077 RepID=A0A9D4Z1Y8_CHLVU|nr:hypothetical protein D9Q98_001280 [Chlorella vulgaris]